MKIRTDFVTNSSSSSFTTVFIENSSLEQWLQENTKMSIEEFADHISRLIDGDGSGYECCSELRYLADCAELLSAVLEKSDLADDASVKKYIETNRNSINKDTTMKVYCASQFEADPLVVSRIECINGSLWGDSVSLDEFEEETVDKIPEDVLSFVYAAEWLDEITPEMIDKLMDIYYDEDDYDDEDDE